MIPRRQNWSTGRLPSVFFFFCDSTIQEGRHLPSCCPPAIPIQHYLSQISTAHLSCQSLHRLSNYQFTSMVRKFSTLLTPWSKVLLEKQTSSQLVKKFPAIHGTRRFITTFTSARHLSLSWARWIQSMPPHPTSWRSILILSSHQHPGLPSVLFPSGFLTKTLYTLPLCPICVTCPAHLILLNLITWTIFG